MSDVLSGGGSGGCVVFGRSGGHDGQGRRLVNAVPAMRKTRSRREHHATKGAVCQPRKVRSELEYAGRGRVQRMWWGIWGNSAASVGVVGNDDDDSKLPLVFHCPAKCLGDMHVRTLLKGIDGLRTTPMKTMVAVRSKSALFLPCPRHSSRISMISRLTLLPPPLLISMPVVPYPSTELTTSNLRRRGPDIS